MRVDKIVVINFRRVCSQPSRSTRPLHTWHLGPLPPRCSPVPRMISAAIIGGSGLPIAVSDPDRRPPSQNQPPPPFKGKTLNFRPGYRIAPAKILPCVGKCFHRQRVVVGGFSALFVSSLVLAHCCGFWSMAILLEQFPWNGCGYVLGGHTPAAAGIWYVSRNTRDANCQLSLTGARGPTGASIC